MEVKVSGDLKHIELNCSDFGQIVFSIGVKYA